MYCSGTTCNVMYVRMYPLCIYVYMYVTVGVYNFIQHKSQSYCSWYIIGVHVCIVQREYALHFKDSLGICRPKSFEVKICSSCLVKFRLTSPKVFILTCPKYCELNANWSSILSTYWQYISGFGTPTSHQNVLVEFAVIPFLKHRCAESCT